MNEMNEITVVILLKSYLKDMNLGKQQHLVHRARMIDHFVEQNPRLAGILKPALVDFFKKSESYTGSNAEKITKMAFDLDKIIQKFEEFSGASQPDQMVEEEVDEEFGSDELIDEDYLLLNDGEEPLEESETITPQTPTFSKVNNPGIYEQPKGGIIEKIKDFFGDETNKPWIMVAGGISVLIVVICLVAGYMFINNKKQSEVITDPYLLNETAPPDLAVPTFPPAPTEEFEVEKPTAVPNQEISELLPPPNSQNAIDPGSQFVYEIPQLLVYFFLLILIAAPIVDTIQSMYSHQSRGFELLRDFMAVGITGGWVAYVIYGKTEDTTIAGLLVLVLVLLSYAIRNDISNPAIGLAIVLVAYAVRVDKHAGLLLGILGVDNPVPVLFNAKDTFAAFVHTDWEAFKYPFFTYLGLLVAYVATSYNSLTDVKDKVRKFRDGEGGKSDIPFGLIFSVSGGILVFIFVLLKLEWMYNLGLGIALLISAVIVAMTDKQHLDEAVASICIAGIAAALLGAS